MIKTRVQIVGGFPNLRVVPAQFQLPLAIGDAVAQFGAVSREAVGAGVQQFAVAADHLRVALDACRPVVRGRLALLAGAAVRRQRQQHRQRDGRGKPAFPGFSDRIALMQVDESNLVWIDLEMSGLDPATDVILEIATLVTDKHLGNPVEGPALVIHQPDAVLDGMDRWNSEHHTASGLVDEVRASQVDCAEAESRTLDFLKRHAVRGKSPMCGNSICQDRRFLARLMPGLESFFHYRNLDVSTIKELAKRWRPEITARKDNNASHRALSDIRGSVEELKHYRRHFLRLGTA